MIKTKLETWLPVGTLLDRAERTFERRSGWTTRGLRSTLENIATLNRLDQVLLGTLVVGRALRSRGEITKVRVRTPRRKQPASAVTAS